MRKSILVSAFLFVLFACGVALAGQSAYLEGNNGDSNSNGANQIGMSNPASVYCGKMGGKTDIITKEDGSQYGMCVFADGTKCEEWAYYKGECVTKAAESTVTTTTNNVGQNEKAVSILYNNQAQTQTSNAAAVRCAVDDSINQEINSLLALLTQAEQKDDSSAIAQIKLKISALQDESNSKLTQCQSKAQTTLQITSEPQPINAAIASAASTGVCYVPEDLQNEYNAAWARYYEAVKSNDMNAVSSAKYSISKDESLINEIKSGCQTTTSGGQSITASAGATSSCSVDSLVSQWTELATQLQSAVDSNDTALTSQIQQKIEPLGIEIAKQLKANCTSTGATPSIKLYCPVESVIYSSLEKQSNSLKAQEYQARMSNDTELEAQLAKKIESLNKDMGAQSVKCQSKPEVISDFMSKPLTAATVSTSQTSVPTTLTEPSGRVGTTAVTATGECTVPVELTQEFEGQWKKYNTAMANNDTETAIAVKAKIAEIEQKLSSTKGQCVKTIVSVKAETSDVVSYYKEKLTETLSTTGDVDTQIASLKQLRTEIDNTIADLIKKKSEFNASDATGLVDEIKVKKNEIMAGSVSIANPTSSINTEVNSKEVKIRSTSTGASINDGNISVATPEVTVSGNKLMVGSNEVKVAPSDVSGKTNMVVNKMSMDTENGKAVYSANGTEKRNLLAVIPVTIDKTVKVDAGNGDVISEDRPWWSFLTTENKDSK